MIIKNYDEAIKHFSNSIALYETFWPSLFFRSQIYFDNYKKNKIEDIKKCIETIKLYIDNKDTNYHVLMDDFDAQYFYEISVKWLENHSSRRNNGNRS